MDLGIDPKELDQSLYIGTLKPGFGYLFWSNHGCSYGEFQIPKDLQEGDRVHIGRKKTPEFKKRRFIVIRMKEKSLELEEIEDGSSEAIKEPNGK